MNQMLKDLGLELQRFSIAKSKERKKCSSKMARSLPRTLFRWRKEILNYFKHSPKNARTEGELEQQALLNRIY